MALVQDSLTVIAICPNFWARAKTIHEALKYLRGTAGEERARTHKIYVTNDPTFTVDDIDGTIYCKQGSILQCIDEHPIPRKKAEQKGAPADAVSQG